MAVSEMLNADLAGRQQHGNFRHFPVTQHTECGQPELEDSGSGEAVRRAVPGWVLSKYAGHVSCALNTNSSAICEQSCGFCYHSH